MRRASMAACPAMNDVVTMDKIVSLCKRRGLIFPASEIYGGIANTYDYGHYSVLLKRNVIDAWGQAMIGEPGDGPECDLTDAREFNLMFETTIGPVREAGSTVYLRPETAQGIFLDFRTVLGFARKKPPFGIAQVGKSFRNEITPGNFVFRTLEFEQMEMEYFVPPAEAEKWHAHWLEERLNWYVKLGIDREKLRLRPHTQEELSHYSSGTSDVEYLYPIGWSELEGVANRGDFDLTQHAKFSGERLEWKDPQTGEAYVPHVVEPAAGVGRAVLALLCDAYDTDEIGGEQRTVLRLHPTT